MTGAAAAFMGPELGERSAEARLGAGWLGISSRRVREMRVVRT